jgi:MOSC domain-containing protein YiiM
VTAPGGLVRSLSRSSRHRFSKASQSSLRLLAGLGVEGDSHAGTTVQHLSRVRRDPSQPNLRQVHLIHAELYEELRAAGFEAEPGELGENITTERLDLLALPRGARLHIGSQAVVEVTGLRNPCIQIDRFRPGMLSAVVGRDEAGNVVRKAGVMSVVRVGGEIHQGDVIRVEPPAPPLLPLLPV